MKLAIMMDMSYLPASCKTLVRIAVVSLCLAGLVPFSTPITAANDLTDPDLNIRKFQLVSESTGWVLLADRLHWTTDNGFTWRDITPSGAEIMDVIFVDGQSGWAVLSQNHPSQFTLASTSNAGQTWDSKSYDFVELAQAPSAVTEVHMGWRSTLDGWLVFKFATGSNFSVGLLYTTNDGGNSWRVHEIPLGEPAVFMDDENGWVAGGPAGKLYHTQDGGESWQEQSPASSAYYQLPIFLDDSVGTLAAVTMMSDIAQAEFFQTSNAGQTWTLAGRVALGADVPFDIALPLSGRDAAHLSLVVPNSDRVINLIEGQLSEARNEDNLSANIVVFDMESNKSGWGLWTVGNCITGGSSADTLTCTRQTKLLSTQDAGLHWQAIALPGLGQTSIQESFSLNKTDDERSMSALAIADPDTRSYVGQGFDKCEVPTATQMQTWWRSSPYNAVNLYIGGSARSCANTALSSSFISQLNTQGWRFIPTWVGPQASCAGYASRMSSNASVAYEQGIAEANLASNTALNLGLTESDGSGTVIYYDLEAYDTSNANCRSAANAFVSGWVAQMRARGNLGGVYGASCASAMSDWAGIANVPDAVWIANWYGSAGAVSYRQTASVWGTYCLSDSLWSNHQRLRQYAGGHNESWGGVTLNIDSNVIDGPLTVRNGTGSVSAPSQPIVQGPAIGSTLNRTDDISLTWKTNGDSCSVHIWGGSMNSTVNTNCAFYRMGVRPGGAYSWQVTSTNETGSTVGPVWQFQIKPHAPSSPSVSSVLSTKLNLSWQLSADDPANLDAYNIYRNGVNIGSVNKSVSTYQVTNLSCNTSHSLYVKSVRQGVESDASSTVNATTATCAPVPLSPVAGVVLENRRPTFAWQGTETATSYQIQVSSYATFANFAINTQVTTTNYAMTRDLLSNTTYYWRVRGVGSFGYGDWSVVENFRTANPPSVPGLSAPGNGSLVTGYTPKLNWTDSVLPSGTLLDHYQVQVAANNTFSTSLYDRTTTISEFTIPAALTPNATYYWRVRAFNTLGQYIGWSPTWSFRTAVLPPALESPADGFIFKHLRPTFEWSDVGSSTRYTLQISRYSNFSSLVLSSTPIMSQFLATADLPRNALLYWRVRTEAANGPSQWSAARTFTTGNPPYIPAPLSPGDNTLTTNYQLRMDWGDVSLPAGTVLDHYQIQLAADSAFAAITSDNHVTVSQYVPVTPLGPNTKYYWRVRAFNTLGHYSAWSTVRYFRTAMLPPVLSAPVNHAILTSLRPVFNWQAVTGAASYTIHISRYSNFSSSLVNAQIPALTYTPAVNLPRGAALYWRVRANGPNGPSLWSPVFQFTIQ